MLTAAPGTARMRSATGVLTAGMLTARVLALRMLALRVLSVRVISGVLIVLLAAPAARTPNGQGARRRHDRQNLRCAAHAG